VFLCCRKRTCQENWNEEGSYRMGEHRYLLERRGLLFLKTSRSRKHAPPGLFWSEVFRLRTLVGPSHRAIVAFMRRAFLCSVAIAALRHKITACEVMQRSDGAVRQVAEEIESAFPR